jgi:predicted transcriptional regulator
MYFNFRLDEEQRKQLDRLAQGYGRSRANLIKFLIKQEADKNADQ